MTVLKSPLSNLALFKRGINLLYNEILLAQSPIVSVAACDYLDVAEISMRNFFPQDGNVSLEEVVFLAALCRKLQPGSVLEIGTFDGNTALQLALNAPEGASIYTLDLPVAETNNPGQEPEDLKYIVSKRRVARRFLGTSVEGRIRQYYGNSLRFDFSIFAADRKPDLIFVDAGHSYECVKNDTEKALTILAPGGTIVWQDYGATWPDVYRYLVELSSVHKLFHIRGTSLVVFRDVTVPMAGKESKVELKG